MSRSGNRHLRPDSDGRVRGLRSGPRTVLVKADAIYAAEPAGQHLLQMLVNLLARQFGIVEELALDVPALPVHQDVFLLRPVAGDLRTELLNLATIVSGPEIQCRTITGPEEFAVTVLVGPYDPTRQNSLSVVAIGEGWRCFCSTLRPAPDARGNSCNPVGPYLSACLAAAAVFKFLRDADASTDISYSAWDWVADSWKRLSVGQEPLGLELPPAYLIGTGAVGGASAFTLAATRASGILIPIDSQKANDTNRNRLLSCAYDDVGEDKVELVARLLSQSALQVFPYRGLWPDYTTDPNRQVPESIRATEYLDRYEWVLSCVDRNIHRRNIAKFLPRHVIGGSTLGLAAQVAYYAMTGPYQCLGCHHPVPALISTEELREQLLSMSREERSEWYQRHDASERSIAAMEAYLSDPNCGGLGEAELARLGREGEVDWAVGFVSVAAGIMQAAVFIQASIMGVSNVFNHSSEFYAWLWKPAIGHSVAIRKVQCDLCGDEPILRRFKKRWDIR